MKTITELEKERTEKEVKKTMQDLWSNGFSLQQIKLFAEMIIAQVNKELADSSTYPMNWSFLKK